MKKVAILLNLMVLFTASCVESEPEPQQVSNVTFTECINTALYLPPAIFAVDFTDLGVNITHCLLDVNCAFDTVLVMPTFENRILTITEQGYPNNANCVCKVNVSYTVGGISEEDIDEIVINGEVAWAAKLITTGAIEKSFPPQRTLQLSFENKEMCAAVFRREFLFNIECLQVEGYNKVQLNISGKSILYEY